MPELTFAAVLLALGFGLGSWATRAGNGFGAATSDVLRLAVVLLALLWAFAALGAGLSSTWELPLGIVPAVVGGAALAVTAGLLARRGGPTASPILVALLLGIAVALASRSGYVLLLVALAVVCVRRARGADLSFAR